MRASCDENPGVRASESEVIHPKLEYASGPAMTTLATIVNTAKDDDPPPMFGRN
jgi:hypothetical protein